MNTLDVIKETYINQLTSLNYDSLYNDKYPNTWDKEKFKQSIENIDTSNKKIIIEQYIDAIVTGLNLNELEYNAYQNSLNKLSGMNINLNELEQILNQYLMQNPDTNLLDPYKNPLNNKGFREKLEILLGGYSNSFSSSIPSISVNPIYLTGPVPAVPATVVAPFTAPAAATVPAATVPVAAPTATILAASVAVPVAATAPATVLAAPVAAARPAQALPSTSTPAQTAPRWT